jgi:enoyl-CoA hydratase/carnithine racemase
MTLNRPERMNAMGGNMTALLSEYWQDFRDDRRARVAILTGAGDRAFSAGADLRNTAEARTREAEGLTATPLTTRRTVNWIPLAEGLRMWKPTIAAINGYCIAGGVMMAIQCDIRIAADHARFGVAETRWNMSGSSWITHLTRIIGLGHALEMCLWGDTQLTAQRALEIGLVNQVVPREQLMDTAMEWASRMVDLAPRAVRNFKETLYRSYSMGFLEAQAFGAAIDQNLRGMKDSLEGPRAFAEKRKPVFRDE